MFFTGTGSELVMYWREGIVWMMCGCGCFIFIVIGDYCILIRHIVDWLL